MKVISLLLCIIVNVFTVWAQQDNLCLTLTFTGDIMMGTTYPSVMLPPNEGRQLFVDAAPILQRADIAAGNLEGSMCDSGLSTKKISKTSYAFRMPTSYAPRLSEAGYDFLSMANNHSNDFGINGIQSTMRCLDSQSIKYAGIKGMSDYAIIERDGIKYGFCAFGHNAYTLRHQDISSARRIITHLVNECDIVIVSFHGGAEGVAHSRLPYGKETFFNEDRGSLRDFAHFCIDAGADIVYGHGPHVVRAVELYKEHFIAYSLGNFCTPYGMSLSGVLAYAPILELRILQDGRFVNGQIHSLFQRRGQGPRLDSLNRASQEIKRLTQLDFPHTPLSITSDGIISHIE